MMTKLLALALASMTLAAGSGPVLAQARGVENSPPTGVESQTPAANNRKAAKSDDVPAYKREISGKVTGIDAAAKVFTIATQGKMVTFSAAKLGRFPRVGDSVDITFTWSPGAPPVATSTTESGASAGGRAAGTHCDDSPGHHHDPFVTLNLKGGCPWW